MTKICCVLGLGYIGLPTAAVLCEAGHKVVGVDTNPHVVSTINEGNVHIVEPGLEAVISSAINNSLLSAHLKPRSADVFIIAVPTPFISSDDCLPTPNIDYVLAATRSIASYVRPGNLILLESTCPVGTTEQVASLLTDLTDLSYDEIDIAYCPERVLPGSILAELVSNDRVIGGITDSASNSAVQFYQTFCKGKLLTTNSKTAELVKLSENSFRDVNIAFANELSILSDHYDIDCRELISLANHHPRVNILNPGCGVGGHCIAVDPWFLASAHPTSTPLIQASRSVNDSKPVWVIDQVLQHAERMSIKLSRKPTIGIFGLSFKPNVDDLRESPALAIALELSKSNFHTLFCEPNIKQHSVLQLSSLEDTLSRSDILVFLVAHSHFNEINLETRHVLDYCGISSPY